MLRSAKTIGGILQIIPSQRAALRASILIRSSKLKCEREILDQAPWHKQLNAANGLLSPEETSAITAHITACRAAQNDYEVAIEAILDDTELDDAQKLLALDAL